MIADEDFARLVELYEGVQESIGFMRGDDKRSAKHSLEQSADSFLEVISGIVRTRRWQAVSAGLVADDKQSLGTSRYEEAKVGHYVAAVRCRSAWLAFSQMARRPDQQGSDAQMVDVVDLIESS